MEHFESFRFRVPSSSGEAPYLVDLTSYNGNGKCDCKDFAVRREPELSQRPGQPNRCKHIYRAMLALADEYISKFPHPQKWEDWGTVEKMEIAEKAIKAFIRKFGPTIDT